MSASNSFGVQFHQIGPIVEIAENVAVLDETGIDHVKAQDRPDGQELMRAPRHNGSQAA